MKLLKARRSLSFWFTCIVFVFVGVTLATAQTNDQPMALYILEQNQPDARTLNFELQAIRPDGTAASLRPGDISAVIPGLQDSIPAANIAPVALTQRDPTSVVLVIDVTDTIPIDVINVQLPSLVRGLTALNGVDISVIAFSDHIVSSFPFSTDLAAAADYIASLDVDFIDRNSNVVVDGLRAGTDAARNVYSPDRDYTIILVTDTVTTDYIDQAALGDIVQQAQSIDAQFYAITLPSLGTQEYPNAELPSSLARQISGVAYLYTEDNPLSADGAGLFLAERINRLLGVMLNSHYDVTVYLDALRGRGLFGDVQLSLSAREGDLEGRATTVFSYEEENYGINFNNIGSNQYLSGVVDLSVTVLPTLPIGPLYTYQFHIGDSDGSSERQLDCSPTDAPICQWDTTTEPPSRRTVQVSVLNGGTVLARRSITVNVLRENLGVEVPNILVQNAQIRVATSGFEGLADTVFLYANDLQEPIARAQIDNSGTTTLNLAVDSLPESLGLPANSMSAQVRLRVEVRNQQSNLLVARWVGSGSTTLYFAPQTFTFQDLSLNQRITGTQSLSLNIAPQLSANETYRYEFSVNEQPLACGTVFEPTCVWNAGQFDAGRYVLQASAYIGADLLYVTTAPLPVNLYRENLTISLPDLLFGRVPITVDTLSYNSIVGDVVVEMSATINGVDLGVVAAVPIDNSGATTFELDLEALRNNPLAAEQLGANFAQLDLHVEVWNRADNLLLAVGSVVGREIVLEPNSMSLVNVRTDEAVTGIIPLHVNTVPALPSGLNYDYQFLVLEEGEREETTLVCGDSAQPTCDWDTRNVTPGFHTVQARVLSGSTVIGETPRVRVNVYRDDLSVIVPEQLIGIVPLSVETQGFAELADVVEVYVTINGTNLGRVTTETVLRDGRTELTVDLDALRASLPVEDDQAVTNVQMQIVIELRDRRQNILIARWESGEREARFSPQSLTLVGLLNNQLVSGTQALSLSVPDLEGAGYIYEFRVDGLPLGCADPTQPICEWNTQDDDPGWHQVNARIISGDQEVIATRPLRANVYREGMNVLLPELLVGDAEIIIDARQFDADIVEISVWVLDGEEPQDLGILVTAQPSDNEPTILHLNVDTIRQRAGISTAMSSNVELRVELRNREENYLVAQQILTKQALYRPTAVEFVGLVRDQLISGETQLQLLVQPTPPADGNYRYVFSVDGQPLNCNSASLTCAWNAALALPGYRSLEAQVFVGDIEIGATDGLMRVNVYRDTLLLSPPPLLIGQVPISVSVSEFPNATYVTLSAVYNGVDLGQIDSEPITTNSQGQVQLLVDVDILQAQVQVDDQSAPGDTAVLDITVEVRSSSDDNALLAQTTQSLSIYYTPTTVGFEDISPNQALTGLVDLELVIDDPPLPADRIYIYEFYAGERLLPCPQPDQPTCQWNTDNFTPGRQALRAVVLNGDRQVLETRAVDVNIYRTNLSVQIPDLLIGQVPITVDTGGLQRSDSRLEVYATFGDQDLGLIDSVTIVNESPVNLTLDADTLRAELGQNAADSAPLQLRFELRDNAENLLLNFREETRTVYFSPTFLLIEGLQPYETVSGQFELSLRAQPALPDDFTYTYSFLVDGTSISCQNSNQPVCLWDTRTVQAGRQEIEAQISYRGRLLLATSPLPLNIFREDLNVTLPALLAGEVGLRVDTAGIVADSAELYAVTESGDTPTITLLDTVAIDQQGEAVVTFNVEELRGQVSYINDDEAVIILRIDLLDRAQNLLMSRWEESVPLLFTPDYGRPDISGLPAIITSEVYPLAFGSYPLTLTVEPAPFAPLDDQLALIQINNPQVPEILATTTDATLGFTLETARLQPGINRIAAAIVRDGIIVAQSFPHEINVYRHLDGVLLAPLTDDGITGNATITVSTSGFPQAGVVAVSADGELVGRTSVTGGDEVEIPWNIDQAYFSNGQRDEVQVDFRVDVLNETGDVLLAQYNRSLFVRPSVRYVVNVTGFPSDSNIIAPLMLNSTINPLPSDAAGLIYLYSIRPVGADAADEIVLATSSDNGNLSEPLNLTQRGIAPGLYIIRITVNSGADPVASWESLPQRVIDITTLAPRRDFANERLYGQAALEVDTPPNVARLRIAFQPDGGTEQLITVVPTDPQQSVISTSVDWQSLYFPQGEAPDVLGRLTLTLEDANGLPLYLWAGTRIIMFDRSVPWWQIGLIGIVGVVAVYFSGRVLSRSVRRLRNVAQGKTRMEDVLLVPIDQNGKPLDFIPLDGSKTDYLIGRAVKKVLPLDRLPDLAFNHRSVSRHVGIIRQDGVPLYFYPDRNVLETLHFNGDPLKEAVNYDAKKRRVLFEVNDEISFGMDNRYRVRLARTIDAEKMGGRFNSQGT